MKQVIIQSDNQILKEKIIELLSSYGNTIKVEINDVNNLSEAISLKGDEDTFTILFNGEQVTDKKEQFKLIPLREDMTYIVVKNRKGIYRIKQTEILFIEKQINKCVIHTRKDTYETVMSMTNIVKVLDPRLFVRTHSGYIVNKSKVSSVSPEANLTYTVHFFDYEKKAYVSRGKRELIFDII